MPDPTLAALIPHFEHDAFECRVLPASETVPFDQLIVLLDDEEETDTPLFLEVAPVEGFEDMTLLQLFVRLPMPGPGDPERHVEAAYLSPLSRLLLSINQALPLVGFGYGEAEGWLYFRHILAGPGGGAHPRVVVETAWLMAYLIDRLSGLITDVATGALSLEEARVRLPELLKSPPIEEETNPSP